jgi:hypothetical protein
VPDPADDVDEAALRTLESEILDYARARPNQFDDFDGVLYWWLYHYRYVRRSAMVGIALARLVADGWLVQVDRHGVGPLYGAGPRLSVQPQPAGGPPDSGAD